MSAEQGTAPEGLRAALAALTRRLKTLDAWIERHEQTHERGGERLAEEMDRLRRELRDREQDVWRLEDELRRGGR
jgi:hypothetical protein